MAATRLTADTSVVVPSLVQWHPLHVRAAKSLASVHRLPAHALAESFSVLTRLPRPHSVKPSMAYRLLLSAFPDDPHSLSPSGYTATVARLAGIEAGGGCIFDAIVGATAVEMGARLLTADRRAAPTYALVGADFDLIT